jgi:hypothetical protein
LAEISIFIRVRPSWGTLCDRVAPAKGYEPTRINK